MTNGRGAAGAGRAAQLLLGVPLGLFQLAAVVELTGYREPAARGAGGVTRRDVLTPATNDG